MAELATSATARPLDWSSGALAQGLSCYDGGEFFEAHEHWESVWLALHEPEKSFLQALIQMTAAFHHFKRGNTRGTTSLLRRTLRRLERCPACFGGIAVAPLRTEICDWLQWFETGGRREPASFPEILPTAAASRSTAGHARH